MRNDVKVARMPALVLGRPEGMAYEEYRRVRKEQCDRLKRRLRGVWVWRSGKGTLVGAVPGIVIQ